MTLANVFEEELEYVKDHPLPMPWWMACAVTVMLLYCVMFGDEKRWRKPKT